MTSSSLVDSTGSNLFYLTAHPDSMSKFRSGRPATNTVQIHDLQTNVVTAYPSVTVAERDTNIHHVFINKHLNKGVYQRDDGRRYKFYRKSEVLSQNAPEHLSLPLLPKLGGRTKGEGVQFGEVS